MAENAAPSARSTLPAGTPFGVGGAYVVRRLLGAGGMGAVYLARQTSLGRDVAIKVLDPAQAKSIPSLRERFLAEPRLMVKFPDAASSHVVPVLDCGMDPASGLPYYVMEAELPGPDAIRSVCTSLGRAVPPHIAESPEFAADEPRPLSLSDFLRDGHVLSDEALARVALDILLALATLHGAGIVHRDCKPSNLLFSSTGRLLLADFGIAKDLSSATADLTRRSLADAQPGTAHYAAPEQRTGLDAVPATDYYALGAILFRALTGGFPATGHLPEDCPTICRRQWQRLLAALLDPDPVRRLHDPAKVESMLRRILRMARRRRRLADFWSRRRKTMASLLGAAAVAVLLAVAAVLASRGERHPAGTQRTVMLPGDIPLKLAWVPAGGFDVQGVGRTHTVAVSRGFWMATGETTRAQWAAVLGAPVPDPDVADLPVSRVSWMDCTNFLARANESLDGIVLSLPTEAEWELAARGGADPGDADAARAWHAGNSGKRSHPVRALPPNAFGLHDMGGNVAEWCRDWNAPDRFGARERVRDPAGPDVGSERVCRGGAYLSAPANVGPAARTSAFPDTRMPHIGFRVVGR